MTTKSKCNIITLLFFILLPQLHAAHVLTFPQIIQNITRSNIKHQNCNDCQQLISGYTRNTLTQAGYIKGVLNLIVKYYHSAQTVEATPTFIKVVNNITQYNPSFSYWTRNNATFDVEASFEKNIEVWACFSFQGSLLVNNASYRTAVSIRTENFLFSKLYIAYSSSSNYYGYADLKQCIKEAIEEDVIKRLKKSPGLENTAFYKVIDEFWINPDLSFQQEMEPLTQQNINRILSNEYVGIIAIIDIDVKKAGKIIVPNP